MRSLKKTRRIQIISIAIACIVAMLSVLWFLPDDSFQFFRSPTEVVVAPPAEGELFRIGGMVQAGSIQRGQGTKVSFVVTDCYNAVPVSYDGILPSLFEEGQGMVGQGRYINGTFEAVEILAKHDETYMPAEVENMHEQQNFCAPQDAATTDATAAPATTG
ncbi:cytochrome c maturation protein CcmE [Thalassorhabdomicrobium marinisediminis]|uniref:cytochrome c maturation protein CcmE n=1 Tax=Thalassorhabdomicrobium marinisediminis TaxID=2170577 RepID=UPI0024928F7C|nr:cytochrome c maturation protein CcmE [Thalassorhabdomicrobium marinisediminis]